MKTVCVSKSESFRETITEDCRIDINSPIPIYSDSDWEEKSLAFFEIQATLIVDALQTHLPGGTLDAVLRELCKRKACLLRVSDKP